jgi:membrane protease YdiL (CAAX protease family)
MDLMGLYILYVIGVALLEELIFRGVAIMVVGDLLNGKKHKPLLTALISSLVFSLFHLTNLFTGADIGSVMLQCLYTFLICGMLAVTMLKGGNVWLCVLIHALFDFGGLLHVQELVDASPWDNRVFWILTIACGILCAGHIIVSLINMERKHVT